MISSEKIETLRRCTSINVNNMIDRAKNGDFKTTDDRLNAKNSVFEQVYTLFAYGAISKELYDELHDMVYSVDLNKLSRSSHAMIMNELRRINTEGRCTVIITDDEGNCTPSLVLNNELATILKANWKDV